MDAIRFSLLAVLVLAVSGMISNDVSAENETEQYFLNAGNGFSTEYNDGEAIEEKPPSSWESMGIGGMGRTREWTTIGTWESEVLLHELTVDGAAFNMWWVEDDTDEDYNARFQMRWTVEMSDGESIAYYEDDDEYTCGQERGNPCEWWVDLVSENDTDVILSEGVSIIVTIEYQSFQDIYIYYDNVTFDSGITWACVDGCYREPEAFIESISAHQAENGTMIEFNGSAVITRGNITSYLWESSIDGELSNASLFNTTNLSLGNHTISFSVNTTEGASEKVTTSVWIYATPVATAGADVTGYPSIPIQFSGVGSDEDGTIVLYEWDFDGDGVFEWNSGDNGVEIYIYNSEGIYNATLRVTDNDGFTGTDVVRVAIIGVTVTIDDEGNVNVTDDEGEPVPSLSIIFAVLLVSLVALFRRR